jgi:CBS domain-containing protein
VTTQHPRILDELANLCVVDVVVRLPKLMPIDARVRDARAAFRDDHVHMLLLTDQGQLRGTLTRADIPDHADDMASSLTYAVIEGRTVSSDLPAEEARQLMLSRDLRRLAVVDTDGSLRGLLCLNRRHTGFCSDEDVNARETARK